MNEYATVEDIAEMMLDLMAQGKGGHTVVCNDEYFLARKGDKPEIKEDQQEVSLGGYC